MTIDEDRQMHKALVGAVLSGVAYLAPKSNPGGGHRSVGLVHEVSMGVRLDLDGSTIDIRWRLRGDDERIVVAPPSEQHEAVLDGGTDVSALEPWPRLLGRRVTDVAVARHRPTEDGEMPWAVRFVLDGPSFVIALGELDDVGEPTYMPDNLVVLFDEQAARLYTPASSSTSAWAERG